MKGLFIPDISSEMFRNGCLESIEALMAEGEIYDIEYEPTVQPYVPYINDGDTVYRQAAIDAVKRLHDVAWENWEETKISANTMIDALKDLPSAQPEIIRCKDCKHFEYDHPYIVQGLPVIGHEVCNAWGDGCKTDENGYCFLAERRTT